MTANTVGATRNGSKRSESDEAPLFQPHTNYQTLDFDKPLSTRMVQKIVKRWADYSRIGDRPAEVTGARSYKLP